MIKYLPELLRENVITQEIADKITDYYQGKKKQGFSKLFVIFGILGALLTGLGIILIIAHNWDKLPRYFKVSLAFLPLISSQFLCGFILINKRDNQVWRESASTFLFLSIGACISLVSQIYHISGNLSTFLLIWMCLSLPVFYLMNSSFASMLYLVGITYYSCECGYWASPVSDPYLYWLLLMLAFPYYIKLIKAQPESNFVRFHNVLIVMSIIISLGTLARENSELMFISYFNVFGILLILYSIPYLEKIKLQDKSFSIIGFLGIMVLLFVTSFKWFWKDLFYKPQYIEHLFISQEMIPLIITTIIICFLLYRKYEKQGIAEINPIELTPLFFIIVYIIANVSPTIAVILINAVLFYLGINHIIKGLQSNHLGLLNLGLLILAILITCRFFDTNFSFLTRGILFMVVGLGFFLTNYQMLKIRRRNEN
jgi:uncharacterized membrane protein